ncbi:MAG: TRAP transporter small permease [Rubrivivax sp.]|nr:TRAP transporter small permease [Rubrivivax sp.]
MTQAQESAAAAHLRLRWEDWLGAAVLALLALITFANVLARYFTNQSFAWTEEISISLMVVLTLVAAGAAVARDRHIRIEVFFGKGSPVQRRALALLSAAATLLAFTLLAALGGRLAWDDFRYEVTSPGIGVPQWWYTVALPVFALAIAARALQQFVRVWRRA